MAAKNPDRPKRHHAKLLLFGEYTIIKGSSALAIPYRALGGEWAYNGKERHLQERLPDFAAYLTELDLPELDAGRFTAGMRKENRRMTCPLCARCWPGWKASSTAPVPVLTRSSVTWTGR